MRAVVLRQFGDPRCLKVEDVPTPAPGTNEVLVEIHAASINPSDVKNVMGSMHGTTLPRIPGRDFAGIIRQGPAGSVGDAVWGTGGDIGFTRDGTHAQFILLPISATTPKPSALSMEAAGSVALTFVTAWSALVTAANISRNETALILGATGGVGSAAVQIAKSRGAIVIGGVRSKAAFDALHTLGADGAIDTSNQDVAETIRQLTNGHGADVVFDTTGSMFSQAIDASAVGGRLPVIAAPHDGNTTFGLRTVYRNQLRILGVDTRKLDAVSCATLLGDMSSAFESGALKATQAEPRALEEAASAYEAAAHGGAKLFLQPKQANR